MGVSEHLLPGSNSVHLSASLSGDLVELASEHLHPPAPVTKHRQVYHEMPRRCPIVDALRSRHIRARCADSWHIWAWRRRTSGVAVCRSSNHRVCACVASTCRMRRLLLYTGSPRMCGARQWGISPLSRAYLWRRPAALSLFRLAFGPTSYHRTQPDTLCRFLR
jgi:hypothetical protein